MYEYIENVVFLPNILYYKSSNMLYNILHITTISVNKGVSLCI
nr:MAG TPA: hypothetical protein [Caudoviricetes sp.]